MRRLLLMLLPVLLVVMVSGCTAPGFTASASGRGVTIEAFEPDFSAASEGETIQLQLMVRNKGSVDASDVKAEIFGMEKWSLLGKGGGSTCDLTDTWGLIAPDEARGTAGGSKSCIYAYKSPDISKGLSMSYTPTVRVSYRYSTNTIKSITLLSSTEARRIEQLGGELPGETLSTSKGPVSVGIVTKGPIKVFKDGLEFPIEFTITNVGGGVVATSKDSNDWNKVNFRVSLPDDLENVDCPVDTNRTLTLFKGKSNTITCTVKASIPSVPKQVQVTASADGYYYFIEKSTKVTVTGI